jgi:hypothetical protein
MYPQHRLHRKHHLPQLPGCYMLALQQFLCCCVVNHCCRNMFCLLLPSKLSLLTVMSLDKLHPLVYIVFNYLCYNHQHKKQCGDIFNKDSGCWLFNINVTCATTQISTGATLRPTLQKHPSFHATLG